MERMSTITVLTKEVDAVWMESYAKRAPRS
jgi:hypothetical protein